MCSPASTGSVWNSKESSLESNRRLAGRMGFQSEPSSAYCARLIFVVVSAARKLTAKRPSSKLAVRSLMRGAPLSITKGSLTRDVFNSCAEGFESRSDALILTRYQPSGNDVESQLRWSLSTSSLSGFHAVSRSPRISSVKTSLSLLASLAAQRIPT